MRAYPFVALIALLACSSEAPPRLRCEPLTRETCPCAIGTGEQTCNEAGTALSSCACPVVEATLREGALDLSERGAELTGRTLSGPPGTFQDVAVGDVVVLFEGTGLLGRVVSIADDGSSLTTEPARLDDAFDALDLDTDQEVVIGPSDLPDAVNDFLERDRIGLSGGSNGFSLGVAGDADIGLSLDGSRLIFRPRVRTGLSLRRSSGIPIGLNRFDFEAELETGLTLRPQIRVEGELSVSLEVELIEAIGAAAGVPELRAEVPLGSGLTARLTIHLGCSLGVDGGINFAPEFDGSLSAGGGIHYRRGRPGADWTTSSFVDQDFSADIQRESTWNVGAELRCSLEPRIELRFLGVAYGYIQGGPYARARLDYGGSQPVTFTADLGVAARLGVGASVETPFGDLELFDRSVDLFDESWNLYRRTWDVCGDGVTSGDERCDDGDQNGMCGFCNRACERAEGICGDGIVDGRCRETCDDGNTEGCDDCVDCGRAQTEICGNGRVDAACGETCDDRDDTEPDGCDACIDTRGPCGDGVVNFGEDCDDANAENCDECHNNCTRNRNVCGDGHVCGDESCERRDWMGRVNEACNPDCTPSVCGDGILTPPEICDDPSFVTCDPDCSGAPECGDGTFNAAAGEECDTRVDTATCDSGDCTLRVCGDGYVNDAVEVCDDGDTDECAGSCNADCTGPAIAAVCGNGARECSEHCDSGAENGTCGSCNADCTGVFGVCGDGRVDASCGEVCDDGNTTSGDGCRADCGSEETCGDGFVDVGEICDDGDTTVCGGSCAATCSGLYETLCGDGILNSDCEVCDDSAPLNDAVDVGCTVTSPNCNGCGACSADVCGDGAVGASEICEPSGVCDDASEARCATLTDFSNCLSGTTSCTAVYFDGDCLDTCLGFVECGNGAVEGFEECDDGNDLDGDGCSAACTREL